MKILQGGFLIIVGVFLTTFAEALATADSSAVLSSGGLVQIETPANVRIVSDGTAHGMLAEADSLFRLKQYTQSFELYQSLFQNKRYSPAMLLKMAYIQEGLGHIGQTMYFLNLYYLATSDPQALGKIEDIAAKNKLEGYQTSSSELFWITLKKFRTDILLSLATLCLVAFAWMFNQKTRQHRRPVVPGVALIALLILIGTLNFLHNHSLGIVAAESTYLMSGPSAGSSVVSIVGEGHRLEILGKKDVWVRVSWLDKEAYVKESDLLPVKL